MYIHIKDHYFDPEKIVLFRFNGVRDDGALMTIFFMGGTKMDLSGDDAVRAYDVLVVTWPSEVDA